MRFPRRAKASVRSSFGTYKRRAIGIVHGTNAYKTYSLQQHTQGACMHGSNNISIISTHLHLSGLHAVEQDANKRELKMEPHQHWNFVKQIGCFSSAPDPTVYRLPGNSSEFR